MLHTLKDTILQNFHFSGTKLVVAKISEMWDKKTLIVRDEWHGLARPT